MSGLQFDASIANSRAWPTAVVVAVGLRRRELVGAFGRVQSLEFPGDGKATFATLFDVEKVVSVAARDAGSPDGRTVVRHEVTEFSVVEALASAPSQAIIDAWGLLEYEPNAATDRMAPDGPHGKDPGGSAGGGG